MPAASGDFGVALADLDINLRIVPSHLWMLDDYLRSIELLMAFILGACPSNRIFLDEEQAS
ncbi:hypothetical protein ACF1BQ_031790 [Bradyrhizobium sp. RDT10]